MHILLTIISGILIILPFLKPEFYLISYIAFIPFLYVIYRNKYKKMFLNAWLLGAVIITGVAYFLYHPLKIFANFNDPLIIIILAAIIILYALVYGLWGLFYGKIKKDNKFNPYIFSLSWLFLEVFRHLILGFFPLGYVGYTQTNFLPIIQLADLGGVFLVSFLIVLINSLIFNFLLKRKKKTIFILAIIVVIIFSYGNYKIDQYNNLNNKIYIGTIQTDIKQGEKWLNENIEKYNNLIINEKHNFSGCNLIIAPESSLTFDMNKDQKYRNVILDKIDEINKYYLLGSLSTRGNERLSYNSSYLISPQGNIKERYNKNKLVLFGEHVVFSDLIEKITGYQLSSLNSGINIEIFETDFAKWKTLICSEILYPGYTAKDSKDLDFIVNQSNEAWFAGNQTLKNQMLASLIFRAVENRKSIIKAGNRAYGGIVYPSGNREIIDTGYSTQILDVEVNDESSFYNIINNFFLNIFPLY